MDDRPRVALEKNSASERFQIRSRCLYTSDPRQHSEVTPVMTTRFSNAKQYATVSQTLNYTTTPCNIRRSQAGLLYHKILVVKRLSRSRDIRLLQDRSQGVLRDRAARKGPVSSRSKICQLFKMSDRPAFGAYEMDST